MQVHTTSFIRKKSWYQFVKRRERTVGHAWSTANKAGRLEGVIGPSTHAESTDVSNGLPESRLPSELLRNAESQPPPSASGSPAFDPLRDGPLRYCGYANECGEAFAAWLPPFGVPFSYAVAITYVLVDTYDKTVRAHGEARAWRARAEEMSPTDAAVLNGHERQRLVTMLTSESAVDTLTWQMLASVILPGSCIHAIVWLAQEALNRGLHLDRIADTPATIATVLLPALATVSSHFPSTQPQEVADVLDKVIPTAIGLLAIPFIVHPIDAFVHLVLDNTLRPFAKAAICDGARGREAGVEFCEVSFDAMDPHREPDLP